MRTFKILFTFLAVTMLLCSQCYAQPVQEPPHTPEHWTNDYEPFRIAGNLYYVGTEDLGSFLVTTPKGHILINTGVASSSATIRQHVEALGFRFSDIKLLLATHAHYDHVGAMAEIKKLTGAKLMINKMDAPVMADGGRSDYVFGGDTSSFAPVKADRLLDSVSVIRLGGMKITALHHPGHTKGATSFLFDVKDDSRTYRVLIANFPTIVFEKKFSELKTYPGAANDYAYTFGSLRNLKFDLWLASHGSQFNLQDKRKPGDDYDPMAFADREGYDATIDRLYEEYRKKLKQK